ncbi:MAG: cell division protein ZapB [Treponema sp.]|nr:cell division protein ZapB [Treponema sp.]
MISLDQVLLLQQKVESAVAKIQQLQAENDALRTKCSELTNALSSKTEQLSTIEVDQNQIENGIKKALDRLNSIENSVLKTVGQAAFSTEAKSQTSEQKVQIVQTAVIEPAGHSIEQNPINSIQNSQISKPVTQPQTKQAVDVPVQNINNHSTSIPGFQEMNSAPVFDAPADEEQYQDDFNSDNQNDDENPDEDLTFDIF